MRELANLFPVFLSGMAMGVMLMAVLQRRSAGLRARLGIDGSAIEAPAKRPPAKVEVTRNREVRR
jgi:hypothetical protein